MIDQTGTQALRFLQYECFKFAFEYLKEKEGKLPEITEVVDLSDQIYKGYLNIQPV